MDIIKDLHGVDWSFPAVGNTGIHAMHWYPATYVSAIPGTLIGHLTSPGDTVLDPFCGSGTSGVEAIRLGRKYVGIDNNPVACLISSAKLYFPAVRAFEVEINKIQLDATALLMGGRDKDHPRIDELIKWYHPETLQEILAVLSSVVDRPDGHIKDCLLAVLSSVLKSTSSQGRHWGWVCDNVRPKSEEIVYRPALTNFINSCNQYLRNSISAFGEACANDSSVTRVLVRRRSRVLNGDSVELMRKRAADSVNLIVTSPPYFGVADYVKSQRLTYLWFDIPELAGRKLGFTDFEALRARESGARSNRSRSSSYSSYIDYMKSFFLSSSRILRDDGYLALVVGESASRPRTTEQLLALAGDAGLSLKMRKERDILSHRRRLMAKVASEDILIFSLSN
ncbi:DNA methyltransferase [Stenotrophomonas forensis]|uniref:Methyltransferase n=1 Tax=Stenotrophomonas forensis TaxID=2871169 RepID=A0ABY7Y0S3_9GAMM|nr:DNA methyltransferase [Stenotrophomonas sp. DFS-20110405]WDM63578.1 site-specific DNA-methyltransferase [Stenotrophomonas sp. DFS-20110405]